MESTCHYCGSVHELATGITTEEGPQEGDLSLCIVCLEVSVYDFSEPGNTRKLTDEEREMVMKLPKIKQAREFFKKSQAANDADQAG